MKATLVFLVVCGVICMGQQSWAEETTEDLKECKKQADCAKDECCFTEDGMAITGHCHKRIKPGEICDRMHHLYKDRLYIWNRPCVMGYVCDRDRTKVEEGVTRREGSFCQKRRS